MMDLKMEVYSPSLELLGLLEVHRSVIWEDKAFTSGSFSIESLITDESMSLLRKEHIVWIEGDTAGIIEYIHEEAGENGPYISVKGRLLTGILDRRILWGRYDLRGTVPDIMRQLVEDCAINPTRGDIEVRKLPGLVLAERQAEAGETIRIQKTGGTLLEALEELGETYQVPFGIRFNPSIPQMEFWASYGLNRSTEQDTNATVFYSTELDDVLSSEYSYNSSDYRNVALVAGEGEGDDRIMIAVEGAEDDGAEPSPGPGPEPPITTKYAITLSVDPVGGGTVTGSGTVEEGKSVTISAEPSSGYEFVGWQENGETVSEDQSYTFTANADRNLTAVFEAERRLPEGYIKLEYIESTGTQHIDTMLRPSQTMRVDIDMYVPQLPSGSPGFFGSMQKLSTYYIQFTVIALNSTTVRFIYGRSSFDASSPLTVGRHQISLDSQNKKARYDDEVITITSPYTFASNLNLALFYSPATGVHSSIYMYSCQIYDSGVLVRDMVPCKNSSGTVGMYDLVNDVFYTNSGTGVFIAGPAI